MTDRLYYTDSYLREFEASIVALSDAGRRVYLDRSAFYPTSGGQLFDTGQLGGVQVTEVIDEGDRIAHVLAEPLSGSRSHGQIDWSRRFDHMQQHTGQHLLSAVLDDLLGRSTVAVHLGEINSTLDLEGGLLQPDEVVRVEDRANAIVAENRPVDVGFEDSAEVTGLRKASPRQGRLRIVTIRDLDRSACGGTHVRATGEIGPILIRRVERARKALRLEFLCGGRAIRAARKDYELLSALAQECTSAPEELVRVVRGLRAELKERRASQKELETTLDLSRARELYATAPQDAAGIRRAVLRQDSGTPDGLKGLAQAYSTLPMAVFVGVIASPPSLVFAASRDAGLDAGARLRQLLAEMGGRGGGSASLAQGVLPGPEQLEAVVSSLMR